jgi:CubicO group peptidase (beta-lactamase class C family)
MSSGLKWKELEIPYNDPENDNMNMYNSGKYLEYVLPHPMDKKPFTEFKYNSGCPVIAAGIIEKTSNMPLDKFAEEFLFNPLGISNYYWLKDLTGLCHAGGGLFLKPADMLKIGVMILNKGIYNDKRIVSEEWINKSVQSYFKTSFDISGYGYFLWIREMQVNDSKTTKVISAEGAGGQKLYIFPEYNLVISFTERNYTTPQVSPLFIQESILPCLQ